MSKHWYGYGTNYHTRGLEHDFAGIAASPASYALVPLQAAGQRQVGAEELRE